MENSIKNNIQVEGDTLIIREGSAPKLRRFNPASYNTNISGPANWILEKITNGMEIPFKNATVVVDKYERKITVHINEFMEDEKSTITGKLKMNPDLEKFNINKNKTWTNTELRQFLKMNRFFFTDPDENKAVVTAMSKFKAAVNVHLEDHNDFKGNKLSKFEQQVTTELKLYFTLTMPLFRGEAPMKFKVDINFNITDNQPTYWLESADLVEIMSRENEKIIDRELKRIKDIPTVFV